MPAKGKCATVNRVTVAKELNLTERRVSQLVAEGMPRASRGKYVLRKCGRWYIRYLQKCLEKKDLVTPDGESGTAVVRLRLDTANAELKEIEVDRVRKEMIASVDVEKALADLVSSTKRRILAVPARASAELVGLSSSGIARVIVERHIKKALATLSVED